MKIAPGVMCFVVDHRCPENVWREVEVVQWVEYGQDMGEWISGKTGWLVKADNLRCVIVDEQDIIRGYLNTDSIICKPSQLMPIKGDENLFKREMIESNLHKYTRKLAEV